MKKLMRKMNNFAAGQIVKMQMALNNNRGDGYIDTAVFS